MCGVGVGSGYSWCFPLVGVECRSGDIDPGRPILLVRVVGASRLV